MQKRKLGNSDLEVSAVGLGCIFFLLVGAGPLSLDSFLVARSENGPTGPRRTEDGD